MALPHIHKSKCRDEIIARKTANEAIKKSVRAGSAAKQSLKRLPTQPKAGYFYSLEDAPETIQPLAYVDLV